MNTTSPTVGVLALQGCVQPHRAHLEACGATMRELRTRADLDGVDGVILPGGESTTMLRLLEALELNEPLARYLAERPVWGICAGAILLARKVACSPQRSLGLLDCVVARNAYGRQLDSSTAMIHGCQVAFIRAPKIVELDSSLEVLARHQGLPVWIAAGRVMATTFHPELSPAVPSPMHREFVRRVQGATL